MIDPMSKIERKAKVTTETIAESVRLREIWDAKNEKPSQAVFGEEYSIGSQSAVTTFLSGKTPISLKAAKGFAKGLGCKISDFSPRLAELANAWPLELVDREAYEALSPALQHKAQVRMDDIIKELLHEQQTKEATPHKVPGIAGRVLEKQLTAESKDFQPGRTTV